jgi:hypothetical protein
MSAPPAHIFPPARGRPWYARALPLTPLIEHHSRQPKANILPRCYAGSLVAHRGLIWVNSMRIRPIAHHSFPSHGDDGVGHGISGLQ